MKSEVKVHLQKYKLKLANTTSFFINNKSTICSILGIIQIKQPKIPKLNYELLSSLSFRIDISHFIITYIYIKMCSI